MARPSPRGAGAPLAASAGEDRPSAGGAGRISGAYLNLDEVIRIIREEDEPKPELMRAFTLTDVQAEAILNMRLRALRKLEELEIRASMRPSRPNRRNCRRCSATRQQWGRIVEEIGEVKKRFAKTTELGRGAPKFPRIRAAGHRRHRGDEGGPDREGAGHGGPVREGLDPRHERPSGRSVRTPVQERRPPENGLSCPDHRQDPAVRDRRPIFHPRRRQAAGRARARRTGAADGRSCREP
jgi:hypothetical protein